MTPSLPPIRFCFGLHLHQPVGNFGYVFEQHLRDVYQPFVEHLKAQQFFPVALHVSGPLLEWLERHAPSYLDLLGELAADGRLELLLAGFYEPVLASLPRADRLEQIAWLREALWSRFGVEARGLWLTERVWEADLTADLHDAGVHFALVDDRHFLVSGFSPEQLHAPYRTEQDGKQIALFPIDERLRYLIPFQPPEETAHYLRALRSRGHRLAVLADDAEKFGGWPGTKEWVYDRGWIDRFFSTMRHSMEQGEVVLSRFDDALRAVPSGGLAYLATASYREMEGWSLPPDAALRLIRLEKDLGDERMKGADGSLVRGAHWRNFLVKYRESNRMHKKMLALSGLCRALGDPIGARRAIGRAQCNDAYWHGVFGGLYLPFLRAAIWENLAHAEQMLRAGERVEYEVLDLDHDGHREIWIHSSEFSAIVSGARGGAVEELTHFASGVNLADALTRRREAYHVTAQEEARSRRAAEGTTSGHAPEAEAANRGASESPEATPSAIAGHAHAGSGSSGAEMEQAPSIHDLEHALQLDELPPVDLDDRALFIERVLEATVTQERYERADYQPVASTARLAMRSAITRHGDRVEVKFSSHDGRLEKQLTFMHDGAVRARFGWDVSAFAAGTVFTTELSLSRETVIRTSPSAEVWQHRIETVAKSERGLDRTLQGFAYLVRWPISEGKGEVEISATPA